MVSHKTDFTALRNPKARTGERAPGERRPRVREARPPHRSAAVDRLRCEAGRPPARGRRAADSDVQCRGLAPQAQGSRPSEENRPAPWFQTGTAGGKSVLSIGQSSSTDFNRTVILSLGRWIANIPYVV